jgi:hypothetical protein
MPTKYATMIEKIRAFAEVWRPDTYSKSDTIILAHPVVNISWYVSTVYYCEVEC